MALKQLTLVAVAVTLLLTLTLTEAKAARPTRCCLPDRFSVFMTDLNSISGDTLSFQLLQYDFVNQKQAILSQRQDPFTRVTNTTDRTVIDFAQRTLYSMPNNDPSQCRKESFVVPMTQCVPDDAKYYGMTYMGPETGGMLYDGWRFTLPNSPKVVTMGTSRDSCVPLFEGLSTPGKPEDDKLYMFTESQPSLKNPDLFQIPSSCQQN